MVSAFFEVMFLRTPFPTYADYRAQDLKFGFRKDATLSFFRHRRYRAINGFLVSKDESCLPKEMRILIKLYYRLRKKLSSREQVLELAKKAKTTPYNVERHFALFRRLESKFRGGIRVPEEVTCPIFFPPRGEDSKRVPEGAGVVKHDRECNELALANAEAAALAWHRGQQHPTGAHQLEELDRLFEEEEKIAQDQSEGVELMNLEEVQVPEAREYLEEERLQDAHEMFDGPEVEDRPEQGLQMGLEEDHDEMVDDFDVEERIDPQEPIDDEIQVVYELVLPTPGDLRMIKDGRLAKFGGQWFTDTPLPLDNSWDWRNWTHNQVMEFTSQFLSMPALKLLRGAGVIGQHLQQFRSWTRERAEGTSITYDQVRQIQRHLADMDRYKAILERRF